MHALKLSLFVAIPLAIFALVGNSAHAYFRQAKSYPNYQPNPYRYGYQDSVSQLIQGQLNFVSNFTYVPSPVHQYFYQSYPSYNYYGGYNSGWGY